MRDWIKLVERMATPDAPIELLDALDAWMHDYSKEDVWTGRNNDLCKRIIELAKDYHPTYSGYLYRGTGIEDELAISLQHGQPVEIPATAKLLSSWTTRQEHADGFADDAVESNMSAVVLRVPSNRLKMVVDMALLYDAFPETTGHESEILVLSEPLAITPADVLHLWVYNAEKGSCEQIR